ncbi:MAG TPA: hypothetical protein VLN45_06075, partial [Ignavibacteriaceae bacterium]|nr:hypothetical protein [Ignavibacteriaceae bacterium]
DLMRNDNKLKNIILSFTNNSNFPSEIFSKNGITETVEDHYSGRINNEYLLGVLATFIAAFDLFFLNNNSSIPEKAEPFNI